MDEKAARELERTADRLLLTWDDKSARDFHELIQALADWRRYSTHPMPDLGEQIAKISEAHWPEIGSELYGDALNPHHGPVFLELVPSIGSDPGFIAALAKEFAPKFVSAAVRIELLAHMRPQSLVEARMLVKGLLDSPSRDDADLIDALFCSIDRGVGWTSGIALFYLLIRDKANRRTYWQSTAEKSAERLRTSNDELLADRLTRREEVTAVIGLLRHALSVRSEWEKEEVSLNLVDVRNAWVNLLSEAVDGDDHLRRAAIDALLWFGDRRWKSACLSAAGELCRDIDEDFLRSLAVHPSDEVRINSRAVLDARFHHGERANAHRQDAKKTSQVGRIPRTWLGDRAAELLIESTVVEAEAKACKEYLDHAGEGEDRLLATLFSDLAMRFGHLDHALREAAVAAQSEFRATCRISYRNVDRPEEGRKGITPGLKFAADLCIIVRPFIGENSLPPRAILVQAKRLYAQDTSGESARWKKSYEIKEAQIVALHEQTRASYCLFLGPHNCGRGVPIFPALATLDLARATGSDKSIAFNTIGHASQSLAEWLTYEVLALRVGDCPERLIKKAEGKTGHRPRVLITYEDRIRTLDPTLPIAEILVGTMQTESD